MCPNSKYSISTIVYVGLKGTLTQNDNVHYFRQNISIDDDWLWIIMKYYEWNTKQPKRNSTGVVISTKLNNLQTFAFKANIHVIIVVYLN